MSKPGKISKAKANLVVDHPFFATLLLEMDISENPNEATASTDGDSITYNPKWIDSLTQDEVNFVLAHEALHVVFDHMGRRNARTPNRWNQAADYIINQLLVDEKIGSMPKGALLNRKLVKDGGETADGVYRLLPASSEKNEPGKPGGSLDDLREPTNESGQPLDEAGKSKRDADRTIRIKRAEGAARSCGKLSQGLKRIVEEAVKPVVDWRAVLRRFMTEKAKTDFSYARPKRRFLSTDLYLPSLIGEKMGSVVIAVDCSGSVDDTLLTKFAAEMTAIRDDVSPSQVDVIYFDSQVLKHDTFRPEDEIIISPCGGGGTAFSPIFKHIEGMDVEPVACIVLTDLCCSDFGPMPSYPVLWTVLEGGLDSAPWGEVLQVEESEEK